MIGVDVLGLIRQILHLRSRQARTKWEKLPPEHRLFLGQVTFAKPPDNSKVVLRYGKEV